MLGYYWGRCGHHRKSWAVLRAVAMEAQRRLPRLRWMHISSTAASPYRFSANQTLHSEAPRNFVTYPHAATLDPGRFRHREMTTRRVRLLERMLTASSVSAISLTCDVVCYSSGAPYRPHHLRVLVMSVVGWSL